MASLLQPYYSYSTLSNRIIRVVGLLSSPPVKFFAALALWGNIRYTGRNRAQPLSVNHTERTIVYGNVSIPCLLGLEKLVSDEVKRLGLQEVQAENGRILCRGTLADAHG